MKRIAIKESKKDQLFKWTSLLIILFGVLFRLSNYLYNHSLWLDEAWVAHDVLIRTFKEIFLNIISDSDLPAIPPVGFLLVEKLSVSIFGNSEFSLRLFPFACGVSVLFFYLILLKKWTDQVTGLMALSFLCFTGSLIYYSAECKQYSGEVLSTVVLFLSAYYSQNRQANLPRVLFFSFIGVVCMFISHTAIFILGGIGITQAFNLLNKNERQKKWEHLFTYTAWLICFIFIYFMYLRAMIAEEVPKTLVMAPSNTFSFETSRWFVNCTTAFFQDPLNFPPTLLAMCMCLLGGIRIFQSDKRNFFMLVIPILLMIIASLLRKFPMWGRFTLFLVPIVLLFVSQGISTIMNKGRIAFGLGLGIFAILLWAPFKSAILNEINPQGYEETRPLIGYLNKNQFPGDVLFMNNSSQDAYVYYFMYYHFNIEPFKQGIFFDFSERDRIVLILKTLTRKGTVFSKIYLHRKVPVKENDHQFKQRAWLLLSHIYDNRTEQFIKDCFDDRGKQLLTLKESGASLYLYELHEPLATINEEAASYLLKEDAK